VNPVRPPDGGDLRDPAAEVVPDQHGALDTPRVEPAEEALGLGGQAQIASLALRDRRPVAGHLPCQAPPTHQGHDVAPQPRRGGYPVHEDDGGARSVREPADRLAVDHLLLRLEVSGHDRHRPVIS
jgi:hypothetical protein